jgi:hypothetical protein
MQHRTVDRGLLKLILIPEAAASFAMSGDEWITSTRDALATRMRQAQKRGIKQNSYKEIRRVGIGSKI